MLAGFECVFCVTVVAGGARAKARWGKARGRGGGNGEFIPAHDGHRTKAANGGSIEEARHTAKVAISSIISRRVSTEPPARALTFLVQLLASTHCVKGSNWGYRIPNLD